MATGDHIENIIRRGYAVTSDTSNTNLVTIDLGNIEVDNALIFLRCWAMGISGGGSHVSRVLGLGGITSGSFVLTATNVTGISDISEGTFGSVDITAPGATTYAIQVSGNSGLADVHWHGRFEIEVTEL